MRRYLLDRFLAVGITAWALYTLRQCDVNPELRGLLAGVCGALVVDVLDGRRDEQV